MTVPVSTRKSGPYSGNGVTTVFAFDFKTFAKADIRVVYRNASNVESDLVLDSDYSVALNSNQDVAPGGSITTLAVAPIAAGTTLTIVGNITFTQPLDITNGGGFFPQVIENEFDRLTMLVQQTNEKANTSFRLPVSAPTGISTQLPLPVANQMVAWNATATGLQNVDPTTLATIVAFGTATADVFSGDGVTKNFTLTNNPGALNNLDVAIGGVTQKPGDDYTWTSGTTLTFLTAPPLGTRNVLARYLQALPQGTSDAASATYTPQGSGAVDTTVEDKLHQRLSVFDFMTDAEKTDVLARTETLNVTAAIATAKLAAFTQKRALYFPAGVYLGTVSFRQNNAAIIGDGSAVTTIKHPPGIALTNVLELGDTASGNGATAYSGNVVRGLTLDGNRANVAAPGSDLVGHGLPLTKISKYHISDVVAINCHNAGFGAFIDSNDGYAEVEVENCGNATYTAPGMDLNSSKRNVVLFRSKGCYSGGRVLDNCYGNIVRGSVKDATTTGFICNNQAVNESFGNDIAVVIDTTGGNGFILSGGFKGSKIDATVKNAGDIAFNTTLYAAVVKTFDGSSGAVVSTANETIAIPAHGFVAQQPVEYSQAAGTVIGGLTGGETYYVIVVDANTVKLATTRDNAGAGTAINLTALGTGVSHTLTFDQSARNNTIRASTYRSANQGVYMGGNNNDWTINTDRDGRGGAVGAAFSIDINGNYNTVRVNHHDSSPWKVRGIAVRAGATGNRVTEYQWDNTLDPWNDAGTGTIGPMGRGWNSSGFGLSQFGAHVLWRSAPTYGVSVAIDASIGNEYDITATNGVGFTVANPTNATNGQRITITVRNTSGGALGAITWDTLYKMSAWTSPANGFSRSIDFKYNGTNWVQVAQTGVDIPN